MKATLLIVSLLLCSQSNAESIRTFTLDQENCVFEEHGASVNKNAATFQGKISTVSSIRFCTISIPVSTYENNFKFCYLSGISVYGTGSCSLRKLKDKYIVESLPDGTTSCDYSCITK